MSNQYLLLAPSQSGSNQFLTLAVFPLQPITANITLTLSGSTNTSKVFNFVNSSLAEQFFVQPDSVGNLTVTCTNDAGLTDPTPLAITISQSNSILYTSLCSFFDSSNNPITGSHPSVGVFLVANGSTTLIQAETNSGVSEPSPGLYSFDYYVPFCSQLFLFQWNLNTQTYQDFYQGVVPYESLGQDNPLLLNPKVGSVGEALSAVRAQAIGKIVYDPNAKTFTLFAHDDTTVLKTLNVTTDSKGNILSKE